MSKSFDRIVIVLVTGITLCVVPYLLRFERTHAGWSASNAEVIEQMSATEREDLLANAKRFNADLTPEKRTVIEEMHDAVSDPETNERFNTYHDWLQELDVGGRDKIRSADSVDDKLTAVQMLIADAEQRAQGFSVNFDDWRIRRTQGDDFVDKLKEDLEVAGLDSVWVSDREHNAMIGVIAGYLPDDAKKEYEASLKGLPAGASEEESYRFRSNALGTAMWNWVRKRRKPPEPNPEAIDQVLDELEDSQTRDALKQLSIDQKRVLVAIMQFRSMDQFRFLVPYLPSDTEVAAFYAGLDRDDQIAHMQMYPTDSRRRLTLMFLAANPNETIPNDIQDMAKSMLQRIDRMSRESERRGGPGRGRRHGDRSDRGERRGPGPPRTRKGDENRRPPGSESPPPKPPPGDPPGPPPEPKR